MQRVMCGALHCVVARIHVSCLLCAFPCIARRNLPGRQPWQQQPQQQQRESGPLDIIAASTMQPPAARHANNSSSEGSSHPDDCQAATAGQQPAPPNGDSSGPSSGSVVGLPPRASKQRAVSQEQQQHQQPRLQKPPHAHLPQQQRLLPQQQQLQGNEQQQQQPHLGPKARIVATQRQIKALSRVSFKSGNWLVVPCPSNKYEVITCFSVTKWIQLNWGDDGIMSLFHKFYRCVWVCMRGCCCSVCEWCCCMCVRDTQGTVLLEGRGGARGSDEALPVH